MYVYDHVGGGVACCMCALTGGEEHREPTPAAMREHLWAHVEAGHHVSMSVLLPAHLFFGPHERFYGPDEDFALPGVLDAYFKRLFQPGGEQAR